MARKLNNNNQALPPVEATILVEGITAPIVKCTARKAFRLNNVVVQAGETFFLVKSAKRANRFYAVRFDEGRNTYACSCGANTCEHAHLKVVREYVTAQVAKESSSTPVPMTVPATSAEVRKARKAAKVEQTSEQFDGSRQITAEEWKVIQKADRKRQKAWADEYRQAAAALAG